MGARRIVVFILLFAAALGSWYLARSMVRTEVDDRPTSNLQSGFYLKSARILGTDVAGQLLYEIEAEFAEQQENNEIEFRNVRIHYASIADVPWTLNADTAVIGEDQQRVALSGHVIAVSNEGFAGEVTEIRTPYLEFEPDSFRAETDRRVQIRIGSRSLTATGMLALLQDNQLQLKSNVSGKFVP